MAPPGKNVFQWGVGKDELEKFLAAHPEKRSQILDSRTVVRRAQSRSLQLDLAALKKYPVLDTLHPGLKTELERLAVFLGAAPERSHAQRATQSGEFYAIPYAVAYPDELVKAYGLLNEAANYLQPSDDEFARYLRNRARDLLSNDYESGDAAWVTGHFKNLNAQIGAYETYDDELYGVKTFFAFSLLVDASAGDDGPATGDEGAAGAGRFAALRSPQDGSAKTFPSASMM